MISSFDCCGLAAFGHRRDESTDLLAGTGTVFAALGLLPFAISVLK